MRPATLRYALTQRLAIDTNLPGMIADLCGFQPRWYRLSTVELAMVALAWAICEETDIRNGAAMKDALSNLAKIATGDNQ
jgi:hypothetical protein